MTTQGEGPTLQALLAEAGREENRTWWVGIRRDLHRHPEPGWREFRTAATVVTRLRELGYEVRFGGEVLEAEGRWAVPDPAALRTAMERAKGQGAPADLVERMAGGLTGVVGTLRNGPGPIVALRFDMDALEMCEAVTPTHRPAREGFASANPEVMHACGHDGHTAIGLGVARVLAAIRDMLPAGTVRLIFQPAEEGGRGAVAMVRKAVVDDADYFLAAHIGGDDLGLGEVVAAATQFLCSIKLDAQFRGRPAHAAAHPEEGRNALLAAATAALRLHAIPRHGGGSTFVNVGFLRAGGSRNVIPAEALLQLETRGETDDLNAFMEAEARRTLEAAATMYGVGVTIRECGQTVAATADPDLKALVQETAATLPGVTRVLEAHRLGGGEDATFFMRRVQERGGKAIYMLLGANQAAGHHAETFDFDEEVLGCGVRLFGAVTIRLLAGALGKAKRS